MGRRKVATEEELRAHHAKKSLAWYHSLPPERKKEYNRRNNERKMELYNTSVEYRLKKAKWAREWYYKHKAKEMPQDS